MMDKIFQIDRRVSSEERARQWIARIDAGPLSVEERDLLQAWLAEGPANADLLDTHALLWSAASLAAFPPLPKNSTASSSKTPYQRWFVPTAAACISLVIAVALWLVPQPQPPGDASKLAAAQTTEIGEHRKISLVDGSHMDLNTATAVRVRYSENRRRVILDRGEGLFDVAKDSSRPFEVMAGEIIVRAVGTRFLVQRRSDGGVEVTVFEGVVELLKMQDEGSPTPTLLSNQDQQPLRLGPGQSAVEQSKKIVLATLAEPALESKLAWQQDRIVFDNAPLAEAIDQINRYSPLPLRISGPELQAVRISGAFSTQNIGVFLRGLEQGFGLKVQRNSDAYMISHSAKS